MFNYYQRLKLSSLLNRPLVTPLSATIYVTTRCQSRCKYCFAWSTSEANQEPALSTIACILKELKQLKIGSVTIGGGEPLLRNDLEDIIALSTKENIKSTILTSGTLLSPERLSAIIEAGASSIILSLDSLDPATNQQQRGVPPPVEALHIISASLTRSFFGGVTCVVTSQNYRQLPDLATKIHQLAQGRMAIRFQPYHNLYTQRVASWSVQGDVTTPDTTPQFSEDLLPQLEAVVNKLLFLKEQGVAIDNSPQFLKALPNFAILGTLPPDYSCYAGYTKLFIMPNLDVRSCWSLPAIGNLQSTTLKDIYFSKGYQRRRQEMIKLNCPQCLLLCSYEMLHLNQRSRK